jgi:hypothetical protein
VGGGAADCGPVRSPATPTNALESQVFCKLLAEVTMSFDELFIAIIIAGRFTAASDLVCSSERSPLAVA